MRFKNKITIILFIFSLLVSSDVFGQYQLHTEFGDTVSCNYRTGGIFAVWWDANFDHYEDAGEVIDDLMFIRDICLNENGLQDPPNPGQGYYYNVYMHHPDDIFSPKGWGNGQGTDKYSLPYLAIPHFNANFGNLLHEGFHIFQYSSNSPGFDYSGDKGWFVEASANWFRAIQLRDQEDVFVTAASISANPQMALWRSWGNIEPGESENWQRSVRQYALNTLLYYLTEEAGVPDNVITGGFYANTLLSPQEYMSEKLGSATMRQYFADWAAHNTGGFDYLTPEQWARAQQEIAAFGDPNDYHDIVHTFTDEGTGSQGITPGEDYVTRGWSYNVYKLNNSSTDTYTFLLDGEEYGTENGTAFFEGRVIVMNGGTPTYYSLEMANDQDGMLTINASPADTKIYLVVAATPDHFGSNQKYNYQVKLYKGLFADFSGSPSTGISPLTVQFTDQSLGSISSYLWDFGDGETSVEQNPSHIYESIGEYDVTLEIVREGNETVEINKSAYISVIEDPQKPYHGTPFTIPGIIEAEDFDYGGEGLAYHDVDYKNNGGTYRNEEGVDIEPCSEGGYNVGWIAEGEWLEYTVNVQTAGSYSVAIRLASVSEESRFHFEVNDVDVTGPQVLEKTGGWQNWKTKTITGVSLQAGKQVIKFVSEGDNYNFNYIVFVNENVFAEFEATPTSGTVPLTTQFTDKSTGEISSYLWDFGDGNTSDIQHPNHTYESIGSFSVSLIVNGSVDSDTLVKNSYINVHHTKPNAMFAADTTSGAPPLTVQFSDSSTGIINSWLWNFGDGDTSNIQHPEHTYESIDNFSVSLIVTGPGGSDTLSKNSYINVQHARPRAMFAADTTSGYIPLEIQFTDSSKGVVTEWSWDFGNGKTSNEKNPSHTYDSVGVYTVKLIVTGPGGEDTFIRENYISVLTIVDVDKMSVLPTEYSLGQNYPNPFNPSTRINYSLPENAHVKLAVYDIVGREVATLVNQVMNAGNHSVNFNTTVYGLSSGIYIYRMWSNSKVFTKKLVFLK